MSISVSKLNEIISELGKLSEGEDSKFNRQAERAKGIAATEFNGDISYLANIESVKEKVKISYFGLRESHLHELIGVVQVMIDEIEITQQKKIKADFPAKSETKGDQNRTVANLKDKIFISHSVRDKQLVQNFTENILEIGLGIKPTTQVFNISIEDAGIKNGEDFKQRIESELLLF